MTFYNIFSNKKEQKITKNIIIDNRERNSLVPAELTKLNFTIEFKQLQVADYLFNEVAIERKTISDLQNSIVNKRIFSQLQELKQYEKGFLLVEGDLSNSNRILNENALRGFIIFSEIDQKIPIIFTKDEKDTAAYIDLLYRRNPDKVISLKDKKHFLNESQQAQYILEGFPNIGPIKAKKLIEKFRSLKRVITAEESELKDILGNKTKEFLELLNHQI